jgi:nitrite reductase (NO-forming)
VTGASTPEVQTVNVAPGGAMVVELTLEVPGQYVLVDHALSRVERGLAAILEVEGPANPEIFAENPDRQLILAD